MTPGSELRPLLEGERKEGAKIIIGMKINKSWVVWWVCWWVGGCEFGVRRYITGYGGGAVEAQLLQ